MWSPFFDPDLGGISARDLRTIRKSKTSDLDISGAAEYRPTRTVDSPIRFRDDPISLLWIVPITSAEQQRLEQNQMQIGDLHERKSIRLG